MPFAAAEQYARTVMAWSRDPLPHGVVEVRDLAYGPHRLQKYNVFYPAGAANAPVLVFWHGGGWTNGYRDYTTCMAANVVAMGMVLVAPSYRLAPEHPLPAAHEDSLQLLAALQRRVGEWGGAADRFYLAGHSAGGHLAALAALRVAGHAAAGIAPGAIRACLPISGIMDLHHAHPQPGSLEERVYTMVLRDRDASDDAVFSPLSWTAGNRIPFALTFGEKDSSRVVQSNRSLLALLQAQGCSVSCVEEPGRDHFQTHTALRDAGDGWYQRLQRILAG